MARVFNLSRCFKITTAFELVQLYFIILSVVFLYDGKSVQSEEFVAENVVSSIEVLEVKTLRTSSECGVECTDIQNCGGFNYDPDGACEFYHIDSILKDIASSNVIYKLLPATCIQHPGFEELTLGGINVCLGGFVHEIHQADQAATLCASKGQGMILMALKTRAMIDDFKEIFNNRGEYYTTPGFWIGLNDREEENRFVWDLDGEAIDGSHEVWEHSQPNGATVQNCTALVGDRYLQDKACHSYYSVVCEFTGTRSGR